MKKMDWQRLRKRLFTFGLPLVLFVGVTQCTVGWPINMSPPILREAIGSDLPRGDNETRQMHAKLDAHLAETFPVGSDQLVLRAELMRQGFKFPKPIVEGCPDDPVLPSDPSCPSGSPIKRLEYKWGGLCNRLVYIRWEADAEGKIIFVDGAFSSYFC